MSIPRPPTPPSPGRLLRSNRNRPSSPATLAQGADRRRMGSTRETGSASGGTAQRARGGGVTGIREPAEVHEQGPGKGSDIHGY